MLDKGYVNCELFWKWSKRNVFFVTRQKDNSSYRIVHDKSVPVNRNILRDYVIEFDGFYARQAFPAQLPLVEIWDGENGRVIVLLTN